LSTNRALEIYKFWGRYGFALKVQAEYKAMHSDKLTDIENLIQKILSVRSRSIVHR
jgi:hypothetical protein